MARQSKATWHNLIEAWEVLESFVLGLVGLLSDDMMSLKEVSLVESFLECLVTLPCVGVVLPSLGNESLDLPQTK
jgi:hypothetical protein